MSDLQAKEYIPIAIYFCCLTRPFRLLLLVVVVLCVSCPPCHACLFCLQQEQCHVESLTQPSCFHTAFLELSDDLLKPELGILQLRIPPRPLLAEFWQRFESLQLQDKMGSRPPAAVAEAVILLLVRNNFPPPEQAESSSHGLSSPTCRPQKAQRLLQPPPQSEEV